MGRLLTSHAARQRRAEPGASATSCAHASRIRHHTLTILVLLGAMLCATGCAPIASRYVGPWGRPLSRAERLHREGERLAAAGKVAEAILSYRQAHRLDPAYRPALRRLAAAYEAQGRRRLARYFYQRLLELDPRDAAAQEALTALDRRLAQGPLPAAWQTFLEEQAISGLAVSDDAVYATTQGGSLFALSRADGAVLWRFAAGRPIVSGPLYSAGPGRPLVLFGADDGVLYALSAEGGQEVWHFRTQAPIHGGPAAAGDAVYVGSTDGHLYAVGRADGALRWHYTTGGAIHASPLVAGDTVYVGSLDQYVYAVNARTGALRWRFAAVAGVESTPVLQGERLFVGANDSRLYCLHPVSGRELWRHSTGDAVYAPPVLDGTRLYLASASRSLFALDLATGQELWRHDAATFLTVAPALHGGRLYLVAASDPQLYALASDTGQLLWAMDTGDWPSAPPLATAGHLYLGGKDGTVVAYRLP